jgi:hypothetical protein
LISLKRAEVNPYLPQIISPGYPVPRLRQQAIVTDYCLHVIA